MIPESVQVMIMMTPSLRTVAHTRSQLNETVHVSDHALPRRDHLTIDGIIDWVVIIIVDSSSARHESPWADSD